MRRCFDHVWAIASENQKGKKLNEQDAIKKLNGQDAVYVTCIQEELELKENEYVKLHGNLYRQCETRTTALLELLTENKKLWGLVGDTNNGKFLENLNFLFIIFECFLPKINK
jgi:hypothetical protein